MDANLSACKPLFQPQTNLSQDPRIKGMAINCMREAYEVIFTPGCKMLRTQGNSARLISIWSGDSWCGGSVTRTGGGEEDRL